MPASRNTGKRGDRLRTGDPTYEARIKQALDGVLKGTYKNYSEAAKALNVAPSTLRDRANCLHQDWGGATAKRQALTVSEEQTLMDWMEKEAVAGAPYNRISIRKQASLIAGRQLGNKWLRGFRRRHPALTSARPQKLDDRRAKNFNRANVGDFFDKYQDLHDEYGGIPPEHIWNMDEKGIQMGGGRKNDGQKCFYLRSQKNRYKISSDNLELATVIECVSAAGECIPPSFVLTNGRIPDIRDLPEDSWGSIYRSESGWTDNENGAQWLDEVFIPNAKRLMVDNSKPILLLMDGHESHETLQLKRAAYRHLNDPKEPVEVIIFCFPSKCTHKMQPLDVGVFSVVGRQWKKHCDDCIIKKIKINRYSIIPEYIRGVRHVISKELIQSSFKNTGIWPINRNVFTNEDFAPSQVTSSQSHVPPSYPPHVRSSSPACPSENDEDSSDSEYQYNGPDDHNISSLSDTLSMDLDNTATTHSTQQPASPTPNPSVSVRSGLADSLAFISESQASSCLETPYFTRSASAEMQADIRRPLFVPLEQDENLSMNDRLKEIRSLRTQLHAMYQALEYYKSQLAASNAHCTISRSEVDDVRHCLENETKQHNRGSTKIKGRFLTKKSLHEEFVREDAEHAEKERLAIAKEAQKAADLKAREERISHNATTKTFTEPFTSFKNKEEFETLARALNISSSGSIKDIQDRLKAHFEEHPDLQQSDRFQGLFRGAGTRRRRQPGKGAVESATLPPLLSAAQLEISGAENFPCMQPDFDQSSQIALPPDAPGMQNGSQSYLNPFLRPQNIEAGPSSFAYNMPPSFSPYAHYPPVPHLYHPIAYSVPPSFGYPPNGNQ